MDIAGRFDCYVGISTKYNLANSKWIARPGTYEGITPG